MKLKKKLLTLLVKPAYLNVQVIEQIKRTLYEQRMSPFLSAHIYFASYIYIFVKLLIL